MNILPLFVQGGSPYAKAPHHPPGNIAATLTACRRSFDSQLYGDAAYAVILFRQGYEFTNAAIIDLAVYAQRS